MDTHDFGRGADEDERARTLFGVSLETVRKRMRFFAQTYSGKSRMAITPTISQLVGPPHPSDDKPADGEDPGESSSPFSIVFLDLKADPAGGEMALPRPGEEPRKYFELTDKTDPGPTHEQHAKTEAQEQGQDSGKDQTRPRAAQQQPQDSGNGRRGQPQDTPKGGTQA